MPRAGSCKTADPCQIKEEVIYMKDKREERQKQRLIEYAKKYAQTVEQRRRVKRNDDL